MASADRVAVEPDLSSKSSTGSMIAQRWAAGSTWQQPFLSIADSWDVTAFVLSHPRPQKANLDRDFPIRAEKPVDAAYGPYLDGFSGEQHKFGPFLPIEEKLATLKAANRDHTPGGN
jgi:thiosulfate dehydrogenase